jgi:hypothetical protein
MLLCVPPSGVDPLCLRYPIYRRLVKYFGHWCLRLEERLCFANSHMFVIKASITAPSMRRPNLGQLPQFSSKDADQATRPNTELRQSVQAESQDSEPGA